MRLYRTVFHLLVVLVLTGVGCRTIHGQQAADPSTITIDVADTAQSFLGFGAHIWTGDRHVGPVLEELGIRYVRMTVGPNWYDVEQVPPTDSSREAMDRFLAAHFDGDHEPRLENAKSSWRIIDRLGIRVIMLQFEAPDNWMSDDGKRLLLPEHVDDYARYWGSLVAFMDHRGMRPTYIELSNEPEGDWNTKILPREYDRLAVLTRKELDARGFHDIGIIGPGLAWLDHDDGAQRWIGALTGEGVEALAGWSSHAWDDKYQPEAPVGYMIGRWRDFSEAVRRKDPAGLKPIIITEYATGATTFNGVAYDAVQSDGDNRASESYAFAQRVFEQTLVHVNQGASLLVVWEAADQPWSDHRWGLAAGPRAERRRPAFQALSTLFPYVPGNAKVIRKTWDDPRVSAAGFLGDGTLVVAMANGTDQECERVLRIDNATGLGLKSVMRYHAGRVEMIESVLDGQALRVKLPAESTLTCVFGLDTRNPDADE